MDDEEKSRECYSAITYLAGPSEDRSHTIIQENYEFILNEPKDPNIVELQFVSDGRLSEKRFNVSIFVKDFMHNCGIYGGECDIASWYKLYKNTKVLRTIIVAFKNEKQAEAFKENIRRTWWAVELVND